MAELRKWQESERVGGHPAVDFVNTVKFWDGDTAGPDHFDSLDDFIDWCLDAELLWPRSAAAFKAAPAGQKGRVFREMTELRSNLHRVLSAMAAGEPLSQAALDHLNDIIRRTAPWRRLAADTEAGCRTICCTWDFADAPVVAALGPVAWAAAELLESGPVERLKECPGEHCAWVFVDVSKNRSRNWCSMKTCGNAAKVKRFRGKELGTRS